MPKPEQGPDFLPGSEKVRKGSSFRFAGPNRSYVLCAEKKKSLSSRSSYALGKADGITAQIYWLMALDFCCSKAGAPKDAAPRFVGEILQNFLLKSNEPFARAFRKYLTSVDADMEALLDNELFKTLFPNTELSVDLKLLTRVAGRMAIGEVLPGYIVRDGEYHFTFMENAPKPKETNVGSHKRNPHVFEGECITVTRRDDGSLRLNFKPLKVDEDFNVEAYAIAVANEIILGLKSPVKEKPGE